MASLTAFACFLTLMPSDHAGRAYSVARPIVASLFSLCWRKGNDRSHGTCGWSDYPLCRRYHSVAPRNHLEARARRDGWKSERKMNAIALMTAVLSLLADRALPVAETPPEPPVGLYLWHPRTESSPSDEDCQALVDQVRPSRAKAEDWLWGRVRDGDPRSVECYLFLSPFRMEPTFAAEGDYDSGSVVYLPTIDGETSFILTPDDHPDTTILGTIVARPGRRVLSVTLKDVPLNGATVDRTTWYCRFEDQGTET